MADRFQTQIIIGGMLDESLVEAFAEAIDADSVGAEWGERLDVTDAEIEIRSAAEKAETLDLYDDECSGGTMDAIESFCAEHKLIYWKHVEGKYEYDPSIEYFDGESSHDFSATEDGEVTITFSDLKKAHAENRIEALIAELDVANGTIPALRIVSSNRERLAAQAAQSKEIERAP